MLRSRKNKIFYIPTKGIADGGLHGVGSSSLLLLNRITSIINNVGVITQAPNHLIRTSSPIQSVVQAVTCNPIIRVISRSSQGGSDQQQMFQPGSQCIVNRSLHCINIIACFDDHITGRINAIEISTQSTYHRIGTATTI